MHVSRPSWLTVVYAKIFLSCAERMARKAPSSIVAAPKPMSMGAQYSSVPSAGKRRPKR